MEKDKQQHPNWQDRINQHEFEFSENAWKKMEKLLDEGVPPIPKGTHNGKLKLTFWRFLIPIIGVLLIFTTIYLITSKDLFEHDSELSETIRAFDQTEPKNAEVLLNEQQRKEQTSDTELSIANQHLNRSTSDLSTTDLKLKDLSTNKVSPVPNEAVDPTSDQAGLTQHADNIDKSRTFSSQKAVEKTGFTEQPDEKNTSDLNIEEEVEDGLLKTEPGVYGFEETAESSILEDKKAIQFTILHPLENNKIVQVNKKIPSMNDLPDVDCPFTNDRWAFGIKAGVDLQLQQPTWLLGGFLQYKLNNKWTLQWEAQYSLQANDMYGPNPRNEHGYNLGRGINHKVVYDIDTVYHSQTLIYERSTLDSVTRLNFFEFPVTAIYNHTNRLHWMAGMQFVFISNYGLNSVRRSVLKGSNDLNGGIAHGKPLPGVSKIDIGIILGGMYDINSRLSVDFRYVQGLIDLTNDEFFRKKDNVLDWGLQLSLKWKLNN